MKKFFLSVFACALAFGAVAQEAANQPQGTWYLGSADATDVVNVFSTGLTTVSPTIGYAVADNIVVSLSLSGMSTSDNYDGTVDETSMTSYGLSAAYFLEGNYYVGAGVEMASITETDTPDASAFGFGIEAGKFIPIRENWYVNPNLSYGSSELDLGGDVTNTLGDSQFGLSIGFGARF